MQNRMQTVFGGRREQSPLPNNGRLFTTIALFAVICAIVFVSGRYAEKKKQGDEPLKVQGFAFDTTYQITLYEGGSKQLLDSCVSGCSEYENIISSTKEGSEVYEINQLSKEYAKLLPEDYLQRLQKGEKLALTEKECAGFVEKLQQKLPDAYAHTVCTLNPDGSISFEISTFLQELVQFAVKYGTLSKGCFTMGIEPVSSLWDFHAKTPKMPAKDELEDALVYVKGAKISSEGHRLQFTLPGTGMEFGGIAKGYIADCMKETLQQGGVTSGLIDLGGNILCIGSKTGGEAFRIGIQQPFADRNEVIATVKVKDVSVVSSGIYERCFEQDGKFYHHILDPQTGYPVENDLMAVTIISPRSVDGDGLSTTCFGLGLKQGMELINSLDDVTAVFITKDEKMHYAEGFQDYMVQ